MTYWNPVERYGVDALRPRPRRRRRHRPDHPGPHPGRGATSGWPPRTRTAWTGSFLVSPSSTDARLAMTVAALPGLRLRHRASWGSPAPARRPPTPRPTLVARVRGGHRPAGRRRARRAAPARRPAAVAGYADGVIVGSALVRCLLDAPDRGRRAGRAAYAQRRTRRGRPQPRPAEPWLRRPTSATRRWPGTGRRRPVGWSRSPVSIVMTHATAESGAPGRRGRADRRRLDRCGRSGPQARVRGARRGCSAWLSAPAARAAPASGRPARSAAGRPSRLVRSRRAGRAGAGHPGTSRSTPERPAIASATAARVSRGDRLGQRGRGVPGQPAARQRVGGRSRRRPRGRGTRAPGRPAAARQRPRPAARAGGPVRW